MKALPVVLLLFFYHVACAQQAFYAHFKALGQMKLDSGITLTFDEPQVIQQAKKTKIIIFALPNGNTTAQTFGKKLSQGDDWHFDIQHIGAQTAFIRHTDQQTNYIVVYLENTLKSWPAWRRKITDGDQKIGQIVELILKKYAAYHPQLTLSGHSGGGSFIFGYLNSVPEIPKYIERIGFLDATYGYETEKHAKKFLHWLKDKHKALQVIAYNDSVVVYNGKPLVSPTGGTWYRSKLMKKDLQASIPLISLDLADRLSYYNKRHNIEFTLIKNPEAKIYHTVLVEKNGFIDLIFKATPFQQKYTFWGDRVYQSYVLE